MCFFYHEKGKEGRKEGREGGKKKGRDREVCKLMTLFISRSLIKRQIKYKREENNKVKKIKNRKQNKCTVENQYSKGYFFER